MKIHSPSSRRGERGVAVIVVLAFLAIILLYLAANNQSLVQLKRQIKLTEQHQLKRTQVVTNAPPVQP